MERGEPLRSSLCFQLRADLLIGGRRFSVGPGDSFRIRGEPFEWINPHGEPAVAIWVIAPPVY